MEIEICFWKYKKTLFQKGFLKSNRLNSGACPNEPAPLYYFLTFLSSKPRDFLLLIIISMINIPIRGIVATTISRAKMISEQISAAHRSEFNQMNSAEIRVTQRIAVIV